MAVPYSMPRGMPIRSAGDMPLPPVGHFAEDIGGALRQTAGDIGEFGKRKAMLDEMVDKRRLAMRVQKAEEEAMRADQEYKEAELQAKEEAAKAEAERYEREEKRKDREEKGRMDRAKLQSDTQLAREREAIAAGKYKKAPGGGSRGAVGPTPKSYEEVSGKLEDIDNRIRKYESLISKLHDMGGEEDRGAVGGYFFGKTGEEFDKSVDFIEKYIDRINELKKEKMTWLKTQQDLVKKGVTEDQAQAQAQDFGLEQPQVNQNVVDLNQEAVRVAQDVINNPANYPPEALAEAQQLLKEMGVE